MISYKELVDLFVRSHNPCARGYSRQYISIAFYRDEEQKKVILDALGTVAKRTGQKVQTAVEPFKRFYRAEDYHQKYYLRGKRDLAAKLHAIYADERGFIDATAAARLNAWAGGYLKGAALTEALAAAGASPEERAQLERLAESLSR